MRIARKKGLAATNDQILLILRETIENEFYTKHKYGNKPVNSACSYQLKIETDVSLLFLQIYDLPYVSYIIIKSNQHFEMYEVPKTADCISIKKSKCTSLPELCV